MKGKDHGNHGVHSPQAGGGGYKDRRAKDLIASLEKELSGSRSLDWQIYCHAAIPGDILIELRWPFRSGVPEKSDIAQALTFELEHLGLVSHTLWLGQYPARGSLFFMQKKGNAKM